MFENLCQKFVAVKIPPNINCFECVTMGGKILVFQEQKLFAFCYDVDKNEWSKKPCAVTKNRHSLFLFEVTLVLKRVLLKCTAHCLFILRIGM